MANYPSSLIQQFTERQQDADDETLLAPLKPIATQAQQHLSNLGARLTEGATAWTGFQAPSAQDLFSAVGFSAAPPPVPGSGFAGSGGSESAPSPAPREPRTENPAPSLGFSAPSLSSLLSHVGLGAPEAPQAQSQPADTSPSGIGPFGGPLAPGLAAQRAAASRQPAAPVGSGAGGQQPPPAAAGPIDNSSPEAFIRTAYPAFLAAAGGNKDLAEMMLAKATSENGRIGKGGDLMGNNFSGIKGKGPTGKSQRLATHEIINGRRVDMEDDFAVYDTPQEGANAFMNFLQDNPRYHKALATFRQSGDTQRLFREVNDAGYATDAGWAEKVASRRANIVAPVTKGLATAAPPAAVGQTPNAGAPAPGTPAGGPAGGLDVSGITKAYTGIPYVFGGAGGRTDPRLGAATDCSGFVASVYKNQFGIDLPAHTDTSYNQLRKLGAAEVSQQEARPGDVVYYMGAGTGGAITHHMGLYAGPGKVLDMASSGKSDGVHVRDIGHGGAYVILRDPRVNPAQPRQATAPPAIISTGYAERSPTEKPTPKQVDAVIAAVRPTPGEPGGPPLAPGPVWEPPPSGGTPAAEAAPFQDEQREAAAMPALHANVSRAFEAANGRPPTAEEAAELASLGFA